MKLTERTRCECGNLPYAHNANTIMGVNNTLTPATDQRLRDRFTKKWGKLYKFKSPCKGYQPKGTAK